MAPRRIQFIWTGAALVRGRLRLGVVGFVPRASGEERATVVVSVRGLLRWTMGAATAGYLLATIALFVFWNRNPYSSLTYLDAALYPLRRDEIRNKQGKALVAAGFDAVKNRHFGEAATRLRLGLNRLPDDSLARLALARIYAAVNQRQLAQALLTQGLGADFPGRGYLGGLFQLAEQGEDFAAIAGIAACYVPALQQPEQRADRTWLLARQLHALLGAGRPQEVWAVAQNEVSSDLINEIRVRALLAMNQPDEALAALEAWADRPDAHRPQILRLRAAAHRSAGRLREMESTLRELSGLAPTDPRVGAYRVMQEALANRNDAAHAALRDYLFRFGAIRDSLLELTESLARTGAAQLVDTCVAAAGERGFELLPFRMAAIVAQVNSGAWREAAAACKALGQSQPKGAPQSPWIEYIDQLIATVAGPNSMAERRLLEMLQTRAWSLDHFKMTIDALAKAERFAVAVEVMALARGLFPASPWLANVGERIERVPKAQQTGNSNTLP